MRHLTIRIHGRVQGVGFRWSAQEKALAMGVTGFVRNASDGTVQIEVEGSHEAIEAYLR